MTRTSCLAWLALAGPVAAQLTLEALPVSDLSRRPGESVSSAFGFFDTQRGRVTLVGGLLLAFPAHELVQFEGREGMGLATTSPFPLRSSGATATDDAGRVIFFGGWNANQTHSNETWMWDSALPGAVKLSIPGTQPPPRSHTAMAFHRPSRSVVLFGGADAAGDREDTWLWRNGTWSPVVSATSPGKRSSHAMAFDPKTGRVVLFGGTSHGTLLADTWAFDGATWTQLSIPGPSPRKGHLMALDEARGDVVLVGGEVGSTASGETWVLRPGGWQLRSGWLPNTLNGTEGVLVFDSRRQQLVHTGGRYSTPLGWLMSFGLRTWDGAAWTLLPADQASVVPDPQPMRRSQFMGTHDPLRDRFVFFGGTLGATNAVVAETWEFSDGLWAQRHPFQSPSARRFGAMTFADGSTWLFGGENALGVLASSDLWRWDGEHWTIAATSGTRPPARSYPSMAFDPLRKRLVLYGGLDQASNSLTDVWEYDIPNARWTPGAGTPPSARFAPAFCWDSARASLLLHGGQLPGTSASHELWSYDGLRWTLRDNTGPALYLHSMCKDEARNHLVVAGGFANPQDTWVFDGLTWNAKGTSSIALPLLLYDPLRSRCTALNTVNFGMDTLRAWNGNIWQAFDLLSPLGVRASHTLTFDPVRRVDVLVGGIDNGTVTGDWWDGTSTTWTRTLPLRALPPRQDHAAAWLPGEDKVLVFGGLGANNALLGDTWLLDAVRKDWVAVTGAGPSARSGHTLCTEESTGRLLLFGGNDGAPKDDTWTFTRSAGWAPLASAPRPPARSAHAMTLYPPTGAFLMFGGSGAGGLLNDLWEWRPTGSGWTKISTVHTPPARHGHALAYDPVRARLVMQGGIGAAQVPLSDLWEFDGRDWIQRTPETVPVALANHVARFDEARGRVVFSNGIARHALWSNVDPAGIGDPAAPLPLEYRTQPVVGDDFRLTFPVNGVGLLYLALGPVTTPRLVLPPPLACRNLDIFVDLRLYVPTTTSEVVLAIPADAAFVGARLTFQALTKGGTSCLTATNALDAVLLARN